MDRWSTAAWCCIVICAFVFFTYAGKEYRSLELLQQGIAENIIRFHVRADSDSDEDQALKLLVKEAVVGYMGRLLADADNVDEAREILNANITNIENVAKGVITEQKKEYNVKAYFENSYFPIKTYGDMTFPAGVYEAFRVDIGRAEGRNWWCVAYPRLCFVDISCGVVPDESKEELAAVLDEDEFALLCGSAYDKDEDAYTDGDTQSRRPGEQAEYIYEFKILKFLNKFFR